MEWRGLVGWGGLVGWSGWFCAVDGLVELLE